MAGIVREDPGIPLGIGAPAPELATLVYMVVSGNHGTGVLAVVVACDIVFLKVVHKHGVTHRMGLPPIGLDTVCILFRTVVRFRCHGPVSHGVLGVELHELCTLGEDNLVIRACSCAYVGPVQDGVVVRGGVDEPSAHVDVGHSGMKGYADSPLHAVTVLSFTNPDGLGAVRVIYYPPVAGHMGSLAVMVEHVPLHAAAYPGTCHAHICRFDAILVVKDVVAVCLVHGVEKAAADFRKHTQFHILVLQVESLVRNLLTVTCHVVIEGIGINASSCSLIRPHPVKDGRLFRRVQDIRRKLEGSFPSFYALGFRRKHGQGQQPCKEGKQSFFHSVILCKISIL